MVNAERNIPSPIKREVRKRCGFGCIICGDPLYEYHHLKGWAKVKEHVAEDITLLCDRHHREVTSGLLPEKKVFEANANPQNLRDGYSSPQLLYYEGNCCTFIVGGNEFTTPETTESLFSAPLVVDGIPLLAYTLESGHLLLSAKVFDQFNMLVMEIHENHLVYTTSPWDIEVTGRTITIRENKREFLVRMTFDPPNRVTIDRARFLFNGVEILVDEDSILITNNNTLLQRNTAMNCAAGLIVGYNSGISGFMALPHLNRYLGDSVQSKRWATRMKSENLLR